jgi:hypothetical protein
MLEDNLAAPIVRALVLADLGDAEALTAVSGSAASKLRKRTLAPRRSPVRTLVCPAGPAMPTPWRPEAEE